MNCRGVVAGIVLEATCFSYSSLTPTGQTIVGPDCGQVPDLFTPAESDLLLKISKQSVQPDEDGKLAEQQDESSRTTEAAADSPILPR